MKIKIGSRWLATGRNLDRFEGEVIRIDKVRRAALPSKVGEQYSKHITVKVAGSPERFVYNETFFLKNFTPIEEQTVRDFKVGDLVEVNFKGTIETILSNTAVVKHEIEAMNFQTTTRNITLLEPAKPKLEAGQVWISKGGWQLEVLKITQNTVYFLFVETDRLDKDTLENFNNSIRKLITEGQ